MSNPEIDVVFAAQYRLDELLDGFRADQLEAALEAFDRLAAPIARARYGGSLSAFADVLYALRMELRGALAARRLDPAAAARDRAAAEFELAVAAGTVAELCRRPGERSQLPSSPASLLEGVAE